jgi:putative redox protein
MSEQATLKLATVEGDGLRFEAEFPRGTIVMDSGAHSTHPNPVQHLMTSLAACMGIDVIGILRKKRLKVTSYAIDMSGERAETPPRRYTRITLTHRITGRAIPRKAVEDAIQLSTDTYCSVHHTLRPDLPVDNVIEITEG